MALEFLKNLIDTKHIVVVDDDPNILRIFGDLLRKRKYEVTTAASLPDLGDLAGLGKVDCFLLDCFLKTGPSGPAIALQLRKAGFDCPICFVTAKDVSLQEEKQLRGLSHHIDLLQKPVTPTALLNKVAELA